MELIARFPQLLLASLREAPWLWAAGSVAVIGLFVLVIWYRRTRPGRRLRSAINALGPSVLHDVLVPDSVESHIHVDYLVLSAAGILVIEVKDYRGMLFGGENTDVWTQVVDGRSYKFENPLYRNRAQESAVKALAPEGDVRGIVLFTEAGRFPRQRPAGVYMLASLGEELANSGAVIPAKLQAAWEQLRQRVRVAEG